MIFIKSVLLLLLGVTGVTKDPDLLSYAQSVTFHRLNIYFAIFSRIFLNLANIYLIGTNF